MEARSGLPQNARYTTGTSASTMNSSAFSMRWTRARVLRTWGGDCFSPDGKLGDRIGCVIKQCGTVTYFLTVSGEAGWMEGCLACLACRTASPSGAILQRRTRTGLRG